MTAYPIPRDVVTPCAAHPDLMFAPKESPGRRKAAKAVCGPCEWKAGCLAWALEVGEQGVWGETDDEDRKALRRELGIKPMRIKPGLTPPGPMASRRIPHGTPIGVEHHRKKYVPLCDVCQAFDDERKGKRVAS